MSKELMALFQFQWKSNVKIGHNKLKLKVQEVGKVFCLSPILRSPTFFHRSAFKYSQYKHRAITKYERKQTQKLNILQ